MVTDVNQYLGNPNLKKANVPVEFTKEQIQEYQKCMDDPVYFIQEYMKIVSLDEGLVPLKCMTFKKRLYKHFMTIVLQFVNFLDSQVNQQLLLLISCIMFCLIQM